MLTILKGLLYDPQSFSNFVRGGLAVLGQGMAAGVIPTGIPGGGGKIGTALTLLAFFIKAGDKNQPTK